MTQLSARNHAPSLLRRILSLGGALLKLLLLLGACCGGPVAHAADYYVDAETGDDVRDGRDPQRAWRSLARVNATTFVPGDQILLKAGNAWHGSALRPLGSGTPGAPIKIGRYGKGASPQLHGEGLVEAVVKLFNQEHWEIAHLEITNYSAGAERPPRRGVEILGKDAGWLHGIHLHDLHIHTINGPPADFPDENGARKNFGGIMLLIEGTEKQTAWDGVLVERCHIHDVSATGMSNATTWNRGHRENNPETWFPSKGVVIRNNLFERTARDGLIVRATIAPLVEYNRFLRCAIEASGNGCWAFDCDDAVFQFNEAAYTKYNPGDHDACGFDSDWNCRRTVFQYNYSHDNDYGFMLICNFGPRGFNDGTIVRYNISQNDGGNIFRFSGPVTGTRVYNNTIFIGSDIANPRVHDPKMRNPTGDPARIVYHKMWGGWSDDTVFANNIFINRSEQGVYEFGESTNNRYVNNLFFGLHPATEPPDLHKLTFDPQLTDPGRASFESVAQAYRPVLRSPVKAAGMVLPEFAPDLDYAARKVIVQEGKVDLGALLVP